MIGKEYEITNNKAILLYFLYKMDLPLINSQITRFFMEKNIMNYFTLQQDIDELVRYDLINNVDKMHYYTLTTKGRDALGDHAKKITRDLMELVDEYSEYHKDILKSETQMIARYKKIGDQEYIATCKVIENEIVLIDLKLSVVSIEQAKHICDAWKSKAASVYQCVIKDLID